MRNVATRTTLFNVLLLAKQSIKALLATYIIILFFHFLPALIMAKQAGFVYPTIIAWVSVPFLMAGFIGWGLPVHLLLVYLGRTQWYWYAIAGVAPCFIVPLVFSPFGADPLPTLLLQGSYFGFFGGSCALLMWFYSQSHGQR